MPDWLRELKQHINDRVVTLLVGNKSDLTESREIPYHIGELFAQRHNMKFIETSAKDSANVEKIFREISETLLKQANEVFSSSNQKKSSDTHNLSNGNKLNTNKISTCC